ncbi:MAG: lipopolysaccharide heptosyltransferase [Deltaproteobacteria bacterium]|nr:lipopolysaccharide heptosyltransferase [Deltaproteobacteria bacterium]
MDEFKNILVVQTAFPGDIVLTTPLFKALKKRFPESRLSVVTTPQGLELLRDIKEIDSLVSYDKRGREPHIFRFLRLINKLRKESFDLCISPHRSFRTALMVYGSGAGERIGYSDAALPAIYTRKVFRDNNLHEVERVLSILDPLGIESGRLDKMPYLEISSETWGRTKKIFDDAGISPNDMVIGIAPGSVWGTKRWTTEGYASLIDRLIERYDARVILLGSPSERDAGDKIIALTRQRPVDLIGKTTLRGLVAVIDRCSLLIGNDSAPGHIASARMVPVVSIFGPTVPSFGYYPYGKDTVIVEKKEIPCRPCHHHGPDKCPEGHFLYEFENEDTCYKN